MKKEAYNISTCRVIRERKYRYRKCAARGGPMDLRCPNCTSTDLKKVSLAYQEGLYLVDTRTRLSGVLIGSGGPDMVLGRARARGFRQTELSKLLRPPVKWSYLKFVLWSGIFSLVALVAYVNHVMASPPSVSVLPVEIYTVLFSSVFVPVGCLLWQHNHGTYPRQYAQWNRSFICQRCGAVSEQGFGKR
jgi:ribosomal protein L40E